MIYAILAAGEGSRLQQEGAQTSKPLISVNGKPVIARLIDIFARNHATAIYVIINPKMKDVEEFFTSYTSPVPVHIIAKSTPDSLHSFYEITQILPRQRFCVTTVDTIFKEDEFSKMIQTFESNDTDDGLFGVTSFVDDEKPLYVQTDEQERISGFFDDPHNCRLVSGGIYCLTNKLFDYMDECMGTNIARMRNFQRFLLEKDFKIKAYTYSKIIDIDHISDIEKAHVFIQSEL